MRELPITVALSVVVHAAALSWFVTRDSPDGPRPVPTAVETPPVETPAVEVALLDDRTMTLFSGTTVATSGPRRDRRADKPASPAIATATPATTELSPRTTEPPTEPAHKRSVLSMRDGRPEPKIHRPGSDGISDETLERMIDGDIPVKIADLPGAQADADYNKAQARLHNSRWVTNATPDQLTGARFDRAVARQAKKDVELVAQKDGTHRTEKTTFSATTNRDGTVDISDKKNWQPKSLFYAEFDVTDALMRRHGQDPYAAEKLKFLDRTRDQRVEIGKRYRSEQLAQSARLMADNLGRLWESRLDPVKQKEELFALWDECAETGNPELVEGGAQARRVLLHWVHVKRVQFTPAELVTFNARRQSKATFAP